MTIKTADSKNRKTGDRINRRNKDLKDKINTQMKIKQILCDNKETYPNSFNHDDDNKT